MPAYSFVQNQGDQQLLNIILWDVQVLGDERNPYACVGLDNIQHNLCANVFEQILNIVSHKWVIIDSAPACTARAFCPCPAFVNMSLLQLGVG